MVFYLEPPAGTELNVCLILPVGSAPSCMCYCQKNFTEALEAYGEAIELDNTNMSFVSNRAAVFFEQKEYEACIAEVSRDSIGFSVLKHHLMVS